MIGTERNARSQVGEEEALQLGVEALQFLASDPLLLERFLRLSGLEPHELRGAAQHPAFFAGLLDFILADERTLQAFAQAGDFPPERVGAARRALAGRFGVAEQ